MSRTPLLQLLERYGASPRITAEERPSLERLLTFVRAEPRCFERSLLAGHVTGSAWLLDHERARCLLTHHKKLGLWLQVGGHADGDPDVLQVALREAREESGIPGVYALSPEVFDVDVHVIPASPARPGPPSRPEVPEHFHYDVRFLLAAPAGAEPAASEESHAVAWVPRAEVFRYSEDASVRRMAGKWSLEGADSA